MTAGERTVPGPDPDAVAEVVRVALAEDLRYGPDATTEATVGVDVRARAAITPREPGVLAGGPVALAAFRAVLGDDVQVRQVVPDGSVLVPGEPVLQVDGRAAGLLTAERTALNLISQLSGVATLTRRWVDAVAGTGARIRDTRKTVPGLRSLQKYAVRCGGGVNHRLGLGDACLIKDNHVVAAGSVTAAVRAVQAFAGGLPLEVEVDTLEQLDEALTCGAGLILLDNFGLAATAEAVRRARTHGERTGRHVELEASGGLTLDHAAAIAATGVDYLAVGALTHSAPIVDLGMDLTADQG